MRNVVSQVRAGYPEYGVQSALAEVEAVLTDTRNHARQLHDRFHNKGHALKTAAEEYIEVERKSQDFVKKSLLKFVIGPKQLSQRFFDLVKRYSPFDLVKLALQQAKELTLQAKLSRFREDEQIKAYLEMLQHGTLEEQRLAEQQLTLIVNAFDQIARCQMEYAVYGKFGNAKYMEEAHQLAVEARAQLKELGVSEKWYAAEVDLRALYSGSPLDALRYDPYKTDGSVMPTIGEQRFAIALGMTHSKYQAWARERYDQIEAGAIAAEAKRKEIALKIAQYNEGIPKPNIEYVQQHLAEKGLFHGEITGEYTPELLQAIEAFQAEFNRSELSKELQHSFGVDGKIDYKLLNLIYLEKGLIEQTPNLFNVCYVPDMLGKPKDTRNGFEKSIDSFKEIGSDMLAASDARFQKAFDSPGDFLNYLTMGIPKGIYDGYVARGEKWNASTYDFIDWLSSGLLSGVHQTVVGAVHPEEAYSKEHWLNSIGLAAMLTSPVKMKPTRPPIPDLNKSSGAFKVNTTTELDKVEGKGIEGTGELAEGKLINRILPDGKVVKDVTELPGSIGMEIPNRLTPKEMDQLTQDYGVEFAQVYLIGPGKNGEGGYYKLFSGVHNRVNVPLGKNIILISHTHPRGTARPSPDDLILMELLEQAGSPQRTSQIVPVGKDPVYFDKNGLKKR
ncbi:peptidoglycan-binding domain-containing protein [Paenibacillus faecis]|uniref:peptidoglycan-binding domain-containing protein n=1 Tax=Paenibacillus faecis TaxID=862114 RepID=UPI001BCF96B0|nr:peptidoglycan-binding domain-containing protein [Paenibacillus faecis]